ncbi:HD domain-containing protein [Ruegeria sp. HKCCD8929]|uniref:HD domain-containing protein n=1 Tax=Ruegeria sp. HKCCD8929 TaxID=2683006 RepID=UPI0020C4931D|nr:HD domain-containing protein [Ruegeria sp. HKCCD8929]
MAELQSQLREVASARMATDPAHDLAHLDRVWLNAQAIADRQANLRVLMAASYLHDLVNLPKNDPDRHLASRHSADQAAPILRDLGFAPAEIEATQHAIAAHSFSAQIPPETPEARILRDADRLDALGAVGIARTFAVAGALGRALYDPSDPFAEHRPLDDLQFSIDHWRVKLLALPEDMLTERGRTLAQERTGRMLRFLEEFAGEIGAIVPTGWTPERNGA